MIFISANLNRFAVAFVVFCVSMSFAKENVISRDNKKTIKKDNLVNVVGAIDFSGKGFSDLGLLGFHYGQPNEFFRLPGRMVLELEGFIGVNKEKNLSQLIFGVSQDIVIPIFNTNFYSGVGIGIYIRTLFNDRIGSAFTFGEKVFIGYNSEFITGGGGYIL